MKRTINAMNNYVKWSLLIGLLFSSLSKGFAAHVDTVAVSSQAMGKQIKNVVVLPEHYDAKNAYPVLYLLHGYSGNYDNWINKAAIIKQLVDQYNYIVVCPDGGFDSWYWDVKNDSNYQYETYVTQELRLFIEAKYAIKKDRSARAISGLSMGGHGALSLAFKHQDLYAAAGSTSGGLDIRPFPLNWNIKSRIGTYAENPQVWEGKTVINMINLLQAGKLDLIIDCGTEDFFYKVNVAFHEKLNYHNISHTFITRAGAHDWKYWSKSIIYQMAFFNDFFNKKVE